MATEIFLTYFECDHACQVGARRHLESCIKGRRARFPEMKMPDELLLHHQHGALAELAFCKLFGFYWGGHINHFHKAYVGTNIEVRWSRRTDLKVRPDDNDVYVASMSGALTDCLDKKFRFYYNGYIHSEDAKREEWKKDFFNAGSPAYFVPHDQLNTDPPPNS